MKRSYLFCAFLFLFITNCDNDDDSNCNNGTFIGEVNLKTQAEVDAFGDMCYSAIDGKLYIGTGIPGSSDITNLYPLSSLTEVFSSSSDRLSGIWIVENNNLNTLDGLHNITSTSGILISKNHLLTNLSELTGLTELSYSVGSSPGLTIIKNDALISLDGLQNINIIESSDQPQAQRFQISIQGNSSLSNLDGLSNIYSFSGVVFIGSYDNVAYQEGNDNLTDFCGLASILSNGTISSILIENNAFNPSMQDIIDGNCSQ